MCSYRQEWEHWYLFLKRVDTNLHNAFCNVCMIMKSFMIFYGGLNDVKRHFSVPEHLRGERAQKRYSDFTTVCKARCIDNSPGKSDSCRVDKVYHGVNHDMSYNSIDCDSKLSPVIFNDSQISSKISLGRNMASTFIYNVLAPASIEDIVEK